MRNNIQWQDYISSTRDSKVLPRYYQLEYLLVQDFVWSNPYINDNKFTYNSNTILFIIDILFLLLLWPSFHLFDVLKLIKGVWARSKNSSKEDLN